ncbi:hypothetical protein HHI36_008922 [Cryptolaemus montrouzieri]|uniref:Uncharacterized protein n=1 Tax=Cryptolaemus montrouzieri TaxID=559131 RepID=A0ABD2MTS6_9CUCU
MAKIPAIPKPISILFIVIDSVSRLNLIRTMPETRDYISQQGFIEMEGYNKVDDNTFPNFLALLNGMNKTQTRKMKCSGRIVNELDSCPMIWYDFRNLGYATAYGEDWGPLGTFNYMKAGFTKPPTDYYFRPYVLASEQLGTFLIDNAPYCAGPETSGERQLNLALDFAKTFKNCPYFGIFWMNTFSHQSINAPLRFDSKIRSFFADLKAEGVLDDSIVVFLSDHGIRMDTTIRKTFSGWFEERLPMNLISVPKWFQEKYKEEYKNLKLNSKKLTSTHDLYMTLQHILKLSVPSYGISSSKACPKCVSLFDEVPNRTCSEAGIPEEWCTCIGQITPLNTSSEIVTEGIKFVLNYMDRTLDYYNATHSCCKLELDRVTLAGISETSELDNEKYLFLNFWTFPFADYIVTLKYKVNENKNNIFRILFEIIRLDRPTSICTINEIASSKIENFCHCCNREISNRL